MRLYDVVIEFKDNGKTYGDDGKMGWLIQADNSSAAIRSIFEVFDPAGREFYNIKISENTRIKQIVLENTVKIATSDSRYGVVNPGEDPEKLGF